MSKTDCSCGKRDVQFITEKLPNGLTRMIGFKPGYECTRDWKTDNKSHGVHGAEQIFVVRGAKGAAHFLLFTNWLPPLIEKHHEEYNNSQHKDPKTLTKWESHIIFGPMAADLGYHTHVPQYEGQTPMRDKCQYTNGNCYYDGSTLNAEELFKKFLKQGLEVVWETLEKEYESINVGRRIIAPHS